MTSPAKLESNAEPQRKPVAPRRILLTIFTVFCCLLVLSLMIATLAALLAPTFVRYVQEEQLAPFDKDFDQRAKYLREGVWAQTQNARSPSSILREFEGEVLLRIHWDDYFQTESWRRLVLVNWGRLGVLTVLLFGLIAVFFRWGFARRLILYSCVFLCLFAAVESLTMDRNLGFFVDELKRDQTVTYRFWARHYALDEMGSFDNPAFTAQEIDWLRSDHLIWGYFLCSVLAWQFVALMFALARPLRKVHG